MASSIKESQCSPEVGENKKRFKQPILLICDIQERFRPVLWEFSAVISTAQKMIKAARILGIPIYATTQESEQLGPPVAELGLDPAMVTDKTTFSMWHAIEPFLRSKGPSEIAIVGVEAHICVTQTALDLLENGHRVYIIADGVTCGNREDVPIALARLRQEGATITTSESWMYECMGDTTIPEFKAVSGLVKDWRARTQISLRKLCG